MNTTTIRVNGRTPGSIIEVEVPDGAVRPLRATLLRVTHTASNNRVSWIGRQVQITMSDGTHRRCEHTSGHRTKDAAVRCATTLVARLNREAGIVLPKEA